MAKEMPSAAEESRQTSEESPEAYIEEAGPPLLEDAAAAHVDRMFAPKTKAAEMRLEELERALGEAIDTIKKQMEPVELPLAGLAAQVVAAREELDRLKQDLEPEKEAARRAYIDRQKNLYPALPASPSRETAAGLAKEFVREDAETIQLDDSDLVEVVTAGSDFSTGRNEFLEKMKEKYELPPAERKRLEQRMKDAIREMARLDEKIDDAETVIKNTYGVDPSAVQKRSLKGLVGLGLRSVFDRKLGRALERYGQLKKRRQELLNEHDAAYRELNAKTRSEAVKFEVQRLRGAMMGLNERKHGAGIMGR